MKTAIICNQKTEYAIVVPAAFAPVEQTAAEELQLYVKKAFGVELSICKEGESVGKAFYIGHTQYAKAAGILGKSEENWIIKMHDGNIVLTGGVKENDRGIIYAVYHFLEDIVGIRWWSVWEEYVPALTDLSLDSDFYKEGTPFFEHRKVLGFRHNNDFYYDARTRCNVVGDDGLENGVYHESIKSWVVHCLSDVRTMCTRLINTSRGINTLMSILIGLPGAMSKADAFPMRIIVWKTTS